MKLSEIFRLVWINLSQNKSKVILTSIGIVVGAATIMLVIAIGQGGQAEVAEQFKNLNAGAIDITYESSNSSSSSTRNGRSSSGAFGEQMPGGTFSGQMPQGTFGGPSSRFSNRENQGTPSMEGSNDMMFRIFGGDSTSADERINTEDITLTVDDVENLSVFVPDISNATISYSTKASIEGGELEESTSYTIGCVKSNYAVMSNLELAIGDFLTDENDESKEKVCVLGYNTAKEIFGSVYDAYNQTVYIDNRPYVVSGIISEMGTVASGISPDDSIFVPYETGIKYLTGSDISPTITVIATDVNSVDTVIGNIQLVMSDSYPNTEFVISDAGTKMEAASKSNDTLQMLLYAMATIVFIVGGIGIMNVLFVSVKERTNEIGILKAIGCSKRDILMEFLMEAVCISFVGAVIGVLLSLGITPIIESFSVRVELTAGGAVLSLIFGVITGTVFGFYPAFKASNLIPVVALNHE